MLKISNIINIERIMRFLIDDELKTITFHLALGHLSDEGDFIRAHKRDNDRTAIIKNKPGGDTNINETLVVEPGGVINLTCLPLASINVRKDGIDIVHIADGQIVTCEDVAVGDVLDIQYYYDMAANMAFSDACNYIISSDDVGKSFRTLTGERSWMTLIANSHSQGEPV